MDKRIVCKECGTEFVFTTGEQRFFESKGFVSPVRCKKCREQKKAFDRTISQSGTGSYIPGAPTMKSPSMYRAITWMCCVNGNLETA